MSWIANIVLWIWGRGSKQNGWNKLFVWLVGQQAPKIWGGKYGAKVHGRKCRQQWLYPKWVEQECRSEKTPQVWDDSGVAWVDGFCVFDLESTAAVGQIEQAIADITAGNTSLACNRLAGVVRSLKMPE